MSVGRLKLKWLEPGPEGWASRISKFAAQPGYITGFHAGVFPRVKLLIENPLECPAMDFSRLLSALVRCAPQSQRLQQSAVGTIEAADRFALQALDPKSEFYPCIDFPGFQRALSKTLREFLSHGIDAEALELYARMTPDPHFAQKCRDLSFLLDKQVSLLEEIGQAPIQIVERQWLDAPLEWPLPFKRLLVLPPTDFRTIGFKVLEKIAKNDVEVTLCLDGHPALMGLAEQISDFLQIKLPPFEPKNKSWPAQLFTSKSKTAGPKVIAFSAANQIMECEWALRLAHEASEGMEHQVAILVPNDGVYGPMLHGAASRLGLSVSLQMLSPLLANGFAHAMVTALKAMAHSHPRGLLELAKSSYFPTETAIYRGLEDQIRIAAKLSSAAAWELVTEYANAMAEQVPWLYELLEWRENAVASPYMMSAWAMHFSDLLELPAIAFSATQALDRLEHDLRAKNALLRPMSDLIIITDHHDNELKTLSEFIDLMVPLWEKAEVSVPGPKAGMRVVMQASSILSAKVVVGLGLLEGQIPRRASEDPILFDEEREELSRLRPGAPALPTSETITIEERAQFVHLCAAAEETLILSYPIATGDRDNIPTSYLKEVEANAGSYSYRHYSLQDLAPPLSECRFPADLEIRTAMDGPKTVPAKSELITEKAKNIAKPDFKEGIDPRMLAWAVECPFKSVAKFQLKIPTETATPMQKVGWILRDSRLPLQPHIDQIQQILEKEKEKFLEEERYSSPPWELMLLESAANRMIYAWGQREIDARNLWPMDPETAEANVEFSDERFNNRMKIGGDSITFSGKFEAIWNSNGVRTVFFPGRSARGPEFKAELDDSVRLSAKQVEFALYLYFVTQFKSETFFQFESAGERSIWPYSDRGGAARGNPQKNLRKLTPPEDMDKFRKKLREKLQVQLPIAREQLDSGKMSAVPSHEACEFCAYEDLCRSKFIEGESAQAGEE